MAMAVAAALTLGGLAINGVIKGANDSESYLELVNRSFVSQGNVVLASQEDSSKALAKLLEEMPGMSRHDLGASLDALMTQTAQDAAAISASMPPNPSRKFGQRLDGIVSARADSVHIIGQTIERLLGMPISVPGSDEVRIRPLLTTAVATQRLSASGAALLVSDRQMGPLRWDFAHAPGGARLQRSVFVKDPTTVTPEAMAALVAALEASSSLAVVHQLELTSVALRPAALPTSTSASTNLPPSRSLRVTALLSNQGTVIEPGTKVTATLTPVSGGRGATVTATGTAQPGGSLSLVLPRLPLVPGTTVTLTVSVAVPAGQADGTGLTQTFTLVVAPATPNFEGG